MKKTTRTLWALTIIGLTSLTANAQINTTKNKKSKTAALTTVTQKLAVTTYLTIGSIKQLPCSTDFEVTFTLANPGTEDLTSATVNYELDGIPATYSWEGLLIAGAEETLTITVPNTLTGQHNLDASIGTLNGSTEGLPSESYNETFTTNPLLTTPAPSLTVFIQPDNFPDEISWKLEVVGGGIIAEGANYNSDPEIVGTIAVPVTSVTVGECYIFTITDDAQDGICCGENGDGYYQILNYQNEVIFTGPAYTQSSSVTFSITEEVASVEEHSFANIKVYPNPAVDIVNLEIPTGMSLPYTYTVYNSLGQVVSTGAVSEYKQQINIVNVAGGVYFLKVDGGNATKTIRFIKG